MVVAGYPRLAALVLVVALLTRQPGDPALYPPSANESAVEIAVVSHGYHTGLALPRAVVLAEAGRQGFPALINVATRFGAYRWVEIGWGEEEFYREVPAPGALGIGMTLRALFRPGNRSVLHVVGLADEPEAMFPEAEIVRLRLSEGGFRRMLAGIDRSFALEARLPQDMGQGSMGRACSTAPTAPSTSSTSAITGRAACSPRRAFPDSRSSQPCRPGSSGACDGSEERC